MFSPFYSSSSINVAAVTETVMVTMETALKHHPMNPSWLRTQADIHYGKARILQKKDILSSLF
jgi:hypothetical protein